MRFTTRELRDLAVAWVALGVAFTFFLERRLSVGLLADPGFVAALGRTFVLSLVTVGVGFLLHELAHKVVAVRYGQVAHFRADYGMLGLAVLSGLAGFLFAAPGAVYHSGRVTSRQNAMIALAGPVTNLGLAVLFVPLLVSTGFVGEIGSLGVTINLLLAAFNLVPFGPLDGRKVMAWSRPVHLAVFVPSLLLAVGVLVL